MFVNHSLNGSSPASTGGCLGGHHDGARPADADRFGRPCGVRAALIIARTGDGRVRAKARGVRFGRPPVLTSHQRLAEGATQADLARTYGVSQATISRLQPLPFGGASVAGA